MDVLMPGINGFDVAKQIKETKPEIKIIIITNAEEEINPERVKDCGIDLYTSKKIMDYTIPKAVRMLKEKLEGK
jgi:DNA-binding NarL/FixJ family response regulator